MVQRLRWWSRSSGPLFRITSNKRPQKARRRPMFWDDFARAMKQSEFALGFDLKRETDLVMVFVGAETKLPLVRQRAAEGAKVVQRVDGLYGWEHGEIRNDPRNRGLLEIYKLADAVIYQSEFNREVFKELLEPPKPGCREYVILNGADPGVFSPQGPGIDRFGFSRMLVTAALWREWKGLDNVINVFLHLALPDTVLVVIGDGCKPLAHPAIRFVGHQPHKKMARFFRSADVFLYFPWFDWCPNTVVQAILCGLPVVCSSRGGTKELVGRSGIVIPSVPEGEIKEYYRPATVDLDQAAQAVGEVLNERERFVHPRPDLHLAACMEKYLNVFREVLGQ